MIFNTETNYEFLPYIHIIDEMKKDNPKFCKNTFWANTDKGMYKRYSGPGRFVDKETNDTAFDIIRSKRIKVYFSEDVFKNDELITKIKKLIN